jgi:hypothetical protein
MTFDNDNDNDIDNDIDVRDRIECDYSGVPLGLYSMFSGFYCPRWKHEMNSFTWKVPDPFEEASIALSQKADGAAEV